ncbi:MAG: HEAT repeat domain-containing protein, partial [Armatimonadetes bacterium]|nr:HEAT repeat domain-containing protein [Armatimonadota bacterium]
MRKNEREPIDRELFERERQEIIARTRAAMAPVFADLQAAGLSYATLNRLRTSGARYDAAIPILLKWLPRVAVPNAKKFILSTLSVPWARTAVIQPLIREFLTWPNNDDGYKWSVGNALELVADQSAFEQLLAIAGDRSNGASRAMIVLWLGKMKDPRAEAMLIESLSDPSVLYCTVEALGKLKSVKARPLIE